jgi:hypothetical protein
VDVALSVGLADPSLGIGVRNEALGDELADVVGLMGLQATRATRRTAAEIGGIFASRCTRCALIPWMVDGHDRRLVGCAERESKIRVIFARRATMREQHDYEEA